MKLLIDMNLVPRWVEVLEAAQFEAVHWSTVGSPTAADTELFLYARERKMVVFTHDLDFGTMLAHTRSAGPSVLQVRASKYMA